MRSARTGGAIVCRGHFLTFEKQRGNQLEPLLARGCEVMRDLPGTSATRSLIRTQTVTRVGKTFRPPYRCDKTSPLTTLFPQFSLSPPKNREVAVEPWRGEPFGVGR